MERDGQTDREKYRQRGNDRQTKSERDRLADRQIWYSGYTVQKHEYRYNTGIYV